MSRSDRPREPVTGSGRPASIAIARRDRASGLGRAAALALALAAGLLARTPSLARAAWSPSDSVAVHAEFGTSADVTNEQYYEDAFLDSISLGRRLVSTPESRVAGVLLAAAAGTRSLGSVRYRIQNELSLGDKIRRETLNASWRDQFAPDWEYAVAPRFEYRKDRTFDRDLQELRGSLGARLRRSFVASAIDGELGASGEFLRTSGQGADYLLDRNAGRISGSLERLPLFGPEWRLAYGLAARVFPDSSARDHLEHGWDGHWRRSFERGGFFAVETEGERRITLHDAPTSRDRFWRTEGAIEAEARVNRLCSLRARLAMEAMTYDQEDTTIFFNYRIVRAQVGPRLVWDRWILGVGPRGEVLRSRGQPAEGYHEIGGTIEVEFLDRGAWWSVAPAGGWRDYAEAAPSDTLGLTGIHSSYAFAELSLLGDQPIPGGLRVRLLGSLRYEWHEEAAEDARSLYFSFDLRRLF